MAKRRHTSSSVSFRCYLHSNELKRIFLGISHISTVLFAVISDWKLGRGKIIIAGIFFTMEIEFLSIYL